MYYFYNDYKSPLRYGLKSPDYIFFKIFRTVYVIVIFFLHFKCQFVWKKSTSYKLYFDFIFLDISASPYSIFSKVSINGFKNISETDVLSKK